MENSLIVLLAVTPVAGFGFTLGAIIARVTWLAVFNR